MASLSRSAAILKRTFDVALSAAGLLVTWPLIAVSWLIATVDTGRNGFFTQSRVGRAGQSFRLVKIRTMRVTDGDQTTVTTASDARITRSGRLLRRLKLDELPQLLNVLAGHMSFVGPRPDVPGFADRLEGDDRVILSVRPGITGPATLKYRNEESILEQQPDPERYNAEVIYPDKVRLNREYVENYRFRDDLYYLMQTLFPSRRG